MLLALYMSRKNSKVLTTVTLHSDPSINNIIIHYSLIIHITHYT